MSAGELFQNVNNNPHTCKKPIKFFFQFDQVDQLKPTVWIPSQVDSSLKCKIPLLPWLSWWVDLSAVICSSQLARLCFAVSSKKGMRTFN